MISLLASISVYYLRNWDLLRKQSAYYEMEHPRIRYENKCKKSAVIEIDNNMAEMNIHYAGVDIRKLKSVRLLDRTISKDGRSTKDINSGITD